VPTEAVETLDFTGRHLRERIPQRQPFTVGPRPRENRRGRTGADASLHPRRRNRGLRLRTGEVWGIHLAWSGNHRTVAGDCWVIEDSGGASAPEQTAAYLERVAGNRDTSATTT
jgi:alpha-galactosidase